MPERVDRSLAEWKRERAESDAGAYTAVGRLKTVTERIVAALEAYFAKHGLSLADFEILAALLRSGKPYRLTQRELGRRVMRTPGTITARVDRLEGVGLVERRPHPEDRRAAFVTLTRRGMGLFERIVEGHHANERALLGALTRSEQRTLTMLLDKLDAGLGDAPPGLPGDGD